MKIVPVWQATQNADFHGRFRRMGEVLTFPDAAGCKSYGGIVQKTSPSQKLSRSDMGESEKFTA